MSAQTRDEKPRWAEALRAIGVLFGPGDIIEIRALNVGRSGTTISGYFNFENADGIAKAVQQLDGEATDGPLEQRRPTHNRG